MKYASLWDWDGVVIDSSRQHEKSWERLAREEGRALPEDHFKRSFGKKNAIIIPEILGWTDDPGEIRRLGLRKEALYREILKEGGEPPELIPGVQDFLALLKSAHIPRVVGTSTDRVNVVLIFELLDIGALFNGVVASEDVTRGKPDPEVFLNAAEKSGVPPGRCVVFEDSLHGIEAGLAGGMKVVGIATTHEMEVLQETGAHKVVPHFQGIDLAFFHNLFR